MTQRILITPRSLSAGDHPVLAPLKKAGYELIRPTPGVAPCETDLVNAVPGCSGWLAGVEPVSPAVIEAADALRVISRNGSGIDNLPVDVITRRGIAIRATRGANARSVAEFSLGLMLAGFRNIVQAHQGICAGGWPRIKGRELSGAEVAVIGLGAIGQIVSKLLLDFGAHVRGVDPVAPGDVVTQERFSRMSVEQALDGAHAVTLHFPARPGSPPLLDTAALRRLAGRAVIVNTAREGHVDANAMLSALESGQVAAYALDTFDREPPKMTRLLRHRNVILTSHLGGFTDTAIHQAAGEAVAAILEELGDV